MNGLKNFIYIIIGLAIVGLISQLFTNTTNFLLNILITIGFGAAIFAVIYFLFLKKRTASPDMKKYKQAVKQSKVKYKQQHDPNVKSSTTHRTQQQVPLKKKISKKRPNHLRVIDGNKSKRKKRASN
ncbi:SA1362 family protein [Ornithinibacillus salinisoli]|uniref:SA1362 family protein n=1 Tax=Ornithinibacillus salinisoli TaxID=1848459 RepID=A0ABW4W419_9BACI